jgi:hypothetical protein
LGGILAGLSDFTHASVRHYRIKRFIFLWIEETREEGAGRKAEWGAGEIQESLNDNLYERFENGRSSADEWIIQASVLS